MSPANDAARRIAALSPEQREQLLRELARVKQEAPPEQPPTPVAAPPAELPLLVPRLEERWQPFPLTDVQEMYWAGRSRLFDLWTPGGNVYIEYELPGDEWFVDKLEQAMRRLCDRHEILRFVMRPDGRGQLLQRLPTLRFELVNLRDLEPAQVEERIAAARERYRYHEGPAGHWPLFGFLIHFLDGERIRIHVWLDCLVVDGLSRDNLWRDLLQILNDPDKELAPLDITYRDYAVAWQEIRQSEAYRRARAYWQRRIPQLPPPLELPLADSLSPRQATRWVDQFAPVLDAEAWQRVKDRAARLGVTPSSVLISAFVETIRAWSRRPRFFFSLEGTYWPPIHPQLRDMVGNFNTIYILAADDLAGTFAERTRRLQDQLSEVIEHRVFTGFQVLREIRRHLGGGTRALSPVMFNSLIELRHASYQPNPLAPAAVPAPAPAAVPPAAGDGPAPAPPAGAGPMVQFEETAYMPQLLMLPAVFEGNRGELLVKFQTVEHLFPPGLIADLRDAFVGVVRKLAESDAAWKSPFFNVLPAAHLERRAVPAAPATPPATLWSLFAAQAAADPGRPAVSAPDRTLTYGELSERADALARRLRALGAGPNQLVAAVLDRGWQQAVAVLGILRAGAACLPLDPGAPPELLADLLAKGARLAVGARLAGPDGLRWLDLDGEEAADDRPLLEAGARDLACAVATRLPEGTAAWALLEHRAVAPVVADLAQRLSLGPGDRLLSFAPPASDLALCELLVPLATGASVSLPAAGDADPASWAWLAAESGATVWSGPPALIERMIARLPGPVAHPPRFVLLGRDTVPVTLPGRLRSLAPDMRIASLAGFPETACAAAFHEVGEVPDAAVRIPAGRPIARQTLHVLDHALEPRPDWVEGDLYIGGPCLARGYLRDEAAGRSRFLVHPRTGERLFRTGLRARFLTGGNLEILGREQEMTADVLGYLADFRQTEAALERQPGTRAAAVRAEEAPGARRPRLVAWVVPEPLPPSPGGLGVRMGEGGQGGKGLPWYLVPHEIRTLDELPLDLHGSVDRSALSIDLAATAEPVPPPPDLSTDPLAQELSRLWCEILGTGHAGADDNFFELGGTSFTAVRVLARIQERVPGAGDLSSFLVEPTVRHLAGLLRTRLGARPVPALAGAPPQPVSLWQRLTGWLRRDPLSKENDMAVPDAQRRWRTFLILWLGQMVSSFGTALGSFALGVWVFQRTGNATEFAMVGFVGMAANLLITPIAGVTADRVDRKKVLLYSDALSAVGTLTMAWLFYTSQMQVWMVYPIVIWMGGWAVFQGPALIATISMLVPREQLIRASGMGQMVGSVTGMVAPLLSAALIGIIGYHGVILMDFVTFLCAAAALLVIRLPRTAAMAPGAQRRSLFRDAIFGWKYIRERNGLFSLLRLFALTNFSIGMVSVLLGPLILSFGAPTDLGTVNAAAAAGAMLGGLALTVWGGPKVRVWGIFAVLIVQGLILQLGGIEPSIPLIAVAAFIFMSTGPIVAGASQAIWQSKVAHEIQGRVFAIRQLVAMSTVPLAYLVAGPLVDKVFGPLLMPGGLLADSVGRVVGVGPGRGAGLMIMVLGLCVIAVVLLSFLNPRLRKVEQELPDVQQPAAPGPDQAPPAVQPEAAAVG